MQRQEEQKKQWNHGHDGHVDAVPYYRTLEAEIKRRREEKEEEMETKRQGKSYPDDQPAPKRHEKGAEHDVKELSSTSPPQATKEYASKEQEKDPGKSTSNDPKEPTTAAPSDAMSSADTADVAAAVGINPGDR